MVQGLIALHSAVPPIIHRDLRSPNVFVRKKITKEKRKRDTEKREKRK